MGFLYIDEKAKVRPILFGGGQQKGMRSGTENVPGCAGLGAAVREVSRDHEATIEKLYQIRDRLIAGLKELPGVTNASISFMAQKMMLEADDDKFDAVLQEAVKVAKKVEPDFEIEL